jgi:putative mRNA 3-end processing factor
VDPWRPVPRAVLTHGHADHARPGSRAYLAAASSLAILRSRLGAEASIEAVDYGDERVLDGVRVSLHPAGHILGSAQVRVEYRGEVWVVSGDFKDAADASCEPFETVRCNVFITESTFGLPVYRWPEQRLVFDEIEKWWSENRRHGRPSVLFVYALGKAQRVLHAIDPGRGPLVGHGAVRVCNEAYAAGGVDLPPVRPPEELSSSEIESALVLAPPSAQGTPWMRRFPGAATAFASGWMRLRGPRRRRAVERGFVLSDHVDWPGLLAAVEATGAERIGVTHGSASAVARWFNDAGLEAWEVETPYDGEATETEDGDHTEVAE